MITGIDIKNFESHRDTSITDIGGGFSVIVGPSMSGKTSILRALRLAAYNDWDPQRLSIGAENSEVTVTTERGSVTVKRGKDNVWVVKNGGTKEFKKIGKQILPEAAKIVGLNEVEIGPYAINLNVMEQFEQHFLLNGIGDNESTPSIRSQALDQICGIDGIEDAVRAVASDHLHLSQQIRDKNKHVEQLQAKLLDEKKLQIEQGAVDKAHDQFRAAQNTGMEADDLRRIDASLMTFRNRINSLDAEMYECTIRSRVKVDVELADLLSALAHLHRRYCAVSLNLEGCGEEVKIPQEPNQDVATALSDLARIEEGHGMAKEGFELAFGAMVRNVPPTVSSKTAEAIRELQEYASKMGGIHNRMFDGEQALADNVLELSRLQEELKELMGDHCPLCGHAIGDCNEEHGQKDM